MHEIKQIIQCETFKYIRKMRKNVFSVFIHMMTRRGLMRLHLKPRLKLFQHQDESRGFKNKDIFMKEKSRMINRLRNLEII